jgi:hypothetical protein
MDGSKKRVTFDEDETVPAIETEQNGDHSTPVDNEEEEEEEEAVSFIYSKTIISLYILDN